MGWGWQNYTQNRRGVVHAADWLFEHLPVPHGRHVLARPAYGAVAQVLVHHARLADAAQVPCVMSVHEDNMPVREGKKEESTKRPENNERQKERAAQTRHKTTKAGALL